MPRPSFKPFFRHYFFTMKAHVSLIFALILSFFLFAGYGAVNGANPVSGLYAGSDPGSEAEPVAGSEPGSDAKNGEAMVLVFNTELGEGTTVSLPLRGTVDVTVDWGDGRESTFDSEGVKNHTYNAEGTYTVEVSGALEGFGDPTWQGYDHAEKLIKVTSFGNLDLVSLEGAFKDASNLMEVPPQLPAGVYNTASMFNNASSFNQDISGWDVSKVFNMRSMFNGAISFNQDIGGWDVNHVTNMSDMFRIAYSFNQDLSGWDVSRVTNMSNMFAVASSFNQPIGDWDVSNVTSMGSMFSYAVSFNQDIGDWDVNKVTDMWGMFWGAGSFNQDLSGWDVRNVKKMNHMFEGVTLYAANYNNLLIGWASLHLQEDVEFHGGGSKYSPGAAAEARQSIIDNFNWTITDGGQSDAPAYLLSLVSNPEEGGELAGEGQYEEGDQVHITAAINPGFDFLNWTDENGAEVSDQAVFSYTMPARDVALTANFKQLPVYTLTLKASPEEGGSVNGGGEYYEREEVTVSAFPKPGYYFIGWIDEQGNSITENNEFVCTMPADHITFTAIFGEHEQTDEMVLVYNTKMGEGTTVALPFRGTVDVTVDWGDANVNTFSSSGPKQHTYADEGTYTVRISGLLERFEVMSRACPSYQNAEKLIKVIDFGDIGLIGLSRAFWGASNLAEVPAQLPERVTSLNSLFHEASSFNQDIGDWDVSQVTEMRAMFSGAESFNQDISAWDVGQVTIMLAMFSGAESFNQDISGWDVSQVTYMGRMFIDASSFNQNIGGWDVGRVTEMRAMFSRALSFNQDIGGWDVSRVTEMDAMFSSAISFNQDISAWDVSQVSNMGNMFNHTALSTANYNNLLIGWAELPLQEDVEFHGGGSQYSAGAATDARQRIIDDFNWIITDGGQSNIPAYMLALSASPEEGGTLRGGGQYEEGDQASIMALAYEGWQFSNWTGDTTHLQDQSLPEGEVTMPAVDVELTANFIRADDTSVTGAESFAVRAFPNPAYHTVYIESDIPVSAVRLFDSLGREVKADLVNDTYFEINVSGLDAGLYFLQLTAGSKTETLKIRVLQNLPGHHGLR